MADYKSRLYGKKELEEKSSADAENKNRDENGAVSNPKDTPEHNGGKTIADILERQKSERAALVKSHENERRDIHAGHREEMRKLHSRHENAWKDLLQRQMNDANSEIEDGPLEDEE